MSSFQTISCEYLKNAAGEESILILRLINSHENFTFSETLVKELLTLLANIENHSTLAVVVLTSAGKVFCAGGDLHAMQNPGDGMFGGTPEEIAQKYQQGIQKVIHELYQLPMVTIAALNGAAVGAGLGLALACDMRYAAAQIKLAESFTRIGLIAGDGDAWLLPRLVGYAHAAYLTLTSDFIESEQAKSIGLINDVLAQENLMPFVLKLAQRIAAHPLKATRAMKKLLQQGQRQTFTEALQQAAQVQSHLHHTAEHKTKIDELLKKNS